MPSKQRCEIEEWAIQRVKWVGLECRLWFVKNTICQLSRLLAIWLLMIAGNPLDLFVLVSIFNCDQKSDDLSYQVWKHVKWTHDIADFVYLLELNLIPRWNGFYVFIFHQGDNLREGFKKSKWKFKMAFAMKGGGGRDRSRVPHTYFEKWFLLKTI